ncbi:MAG TPA: ABC transporter substrate-binding protein [Candidatus Nanoarchaeia archaeon]|nr:ABC transporter substrate-binding protein [Candidatus Nanoarchaeia archaeon]
MKNAKLFITILIIALVVGAFFVFFPKQEEQKVVRIGYLPITASLPLFVAQENGYFLEEGLNVELVKAETSNIIMESLVSGKLDLTSSVAYSTLFPIESTDPGNFIIFSGVSETGDTFANFLLVKRDSDIRSILDLKGKRIVTRSGAAMKTYTSLVLEKFGLTLSDVVLQQVSPSLLISTFNSPEVDAIYDVEPAMTIILESGNGKILEENPRVKYVLNPFPVAGSVFSAKFVENNPSTAEKIAKITDKAIDYINQNPEEAKQILTKYTPLTSDIASKTRLYKFDKLAEIDKESVQKLTDIENPNNEITVSRLFYNP